jgi:hypothetical protein
VQTIAILREDRDALQRRVEELEAENKADETPAWRIVIPFRHNSPLRNVTKAAVKAETRPLSY